MNKQSFFIFFLGLQIVWVHKSVSTLKKLDLPSFSIVKKQRLNLTKEQDFSKEISW